MFLPVSVVPLQLRMINNTGLILVHKKSALITPWNLSFGSNSEDENVDVKYVKHLLSCKLKVLNGKF